MSDGICPELRDKITQTHTMMQVLVKDLDEQKKVNHARLREVKKDLDKHKEESEETFKLFQSEINDAKTFRTKVVTYASIAAGVVAFFSDPVIRFIKMFFQA